MQNSTHTAVVTSLPFRSERWTDAEIVRGVAGRYPPAGRALFDRYNGYVSGRVRRLLGSDSECSDQVQQVFAQIVANISSLRDPDMLVRWINRIIVNTVRKELRRRKRRWFLLYTSDLPDTADPAGQETAALFHRALTVLNRVGPEERIAFVLRFALKEEVADIAEMCGWSLSTAKRRISKGKECFMRYAVLDPLLGAYATRLSNE